MPNNRNLGGVFMTDKDGQMGKGTLASSEFVCGLIFDTSVFGGIANVLTGDAAKNFANGNVVELNSLEDVKKAGIDEAQMCGLPYYHLSTFFTLAGNNQRLFLAFMDSTTDANYSAIEKLQLASGGLIYQVGLWTGNAFAKNGKSGDYTVENASLLSKLQAQAEILGGKIGTTNYDGNQPLNVILTAPPIDEAVCDITKLPDLSTLDMPKVSIMLGQASTDEVHKIQLDMIKKNAETPHYVQVGCIGAVLACLAVAPVEVNIGNTNFNLNSVMTECEFGFGDLTLNTGKTAFADTASFNNIKTIRYQLRNKTHQKCYNFLMNYDGLENGVFISDDQTLTTGDYRSLTRCRTIHKTRRVVRLNLLPLVKQDFFVDTSTGYLTDADVTTIQNAVYDALDKNMVDPGTTTSQISGRQVNIDGEQDILNDDQFIISYDIVPKGYTSAIHCSEGFVKSITA